jgi:hypothetical protein
MGMRTLEKPAHKDFTRPSRCPIIHSYTQRPLMTKCIRDGKVAILYSPGFGAGWSTWNNDEYREFLLHDEKLVELVETKQKGKIVEYVKSVYPGEYLTLLDLAKLEVEWVSSGTQFIITEYDGSEGIEYNYDNFWNVA